MYRAGRTGRAGKSGTVVSFFTSKDSVLKTMISEQLNESFQMEGSEEDVLRPFLGYNPQQIENLRYRALDVFRSITGKMVKLARKKDLKNEILKSKELATYFEAHPKEKHLLENLGNQQKRRFEAIDKFPSYIVSPENRNIPPPAKISRIDPLAQKVGKRRKRKRTL